MNNPFHTDPFRVVFRFAGLAAIFYGLFIVGFPMLAANSAFGSFSRAPLAVFGLLLIAGGVMQFTGCCLYRRTLAVGGAVLSMSMFLAAELSCLFAASINTGIPAYVVIPGFYLMLIHGAFRVEIPCARSSRAAT